MCVQDRIVLWEKQAGPLPSSWMRPGNAVQLWQTPPYLLQCRSAERMNPDLSNTPGLRVHMHNRVPVLM